MPDLTLSVDGGLATYLSDLRRPTNKAKVLNNFNQIKAGVFTTRMRGWERVREDVFNAGAAFRGFAEFTLAVDGSNNLLFQVGDKLYSYDFGTETETEIANSLDPDAIPTIQMFQPYASGPSFGVYTNGVDEPLKIEDLSTSSALELNGAPYPTALATPVTKTYSKPKFTVPFLDRLVIFGFDGDETRHDILITNSGEAETVSQATPALATDGDVQQISPALGNPTGGVSFRLSNAEMNQIVLIACERGVCMLSGTDATNFSIVELTKEYGIPSNHTWIPLYNDMWFLTTKGWSNFSTLATNSALVNDMLSREIQDIVARINPAHAHKAHAFHHKGYQDVVVWFPLDSNTECSDAIIANYNNDMTQRGNPVPQWFTKSGTTVTASIYFEGVAYGGGEDGIFQKHYTGTKYDTEPVPFELRTALLGSQNPLRSLNVEQIGVVCEGGSQKFLINAFIYERNVAENLVLTQAEPADFEMTADDTGSITILDSWVADVSTFPSDQPKVLKYYNFTGACDFAEFQIKGETEDSNIDFVQIVVDAELLSNKL